MWFARRVGALVLVGGLTLVLAGCPGSLGSRGPKCIDPARDTVSQGWMCDLPAVDTTTLTTAQRSLWSTLDQAYADQQPGTVYSQGKSEAWCADFVSWVYNEAGYPFSNPNSGSWRIPGTFTLAEYFQTQHVFHSPGETGFTPRLGDVAIYTNESLVWTQHTNIVIGYDGTWLVTIGGNQSHGAVTVYRHRWDNPDLHVRGFGRPLPG